MEGVDYKNSLKLVAAPWLVTVSGPVIRNGAVLLTRDVVVATGYQAELEKEYPDIAVTRFPGVLLPGLINAHMHLELSHLPAQKPLGQNETFIDWVEQLLVKRFTSNFLEAEIEEYAKRQVVKQYETGVIFIGDIGNTPRDKTFGLSEDSTPTIYSMREFLGSSVEAVDAAGCELDTLHPEIVAVPHAPYSTRPELLIKIKNRCRKNNHIYSIHTAETSGETEFISASKGIFQDFLVKRGSWSDDYFGERIPVNSTIEYFDGLNLLDNKTLLVHCVHVSESDLDLVINAGAHICLCPGSNEFLHSGTAPIAAMLSKGITPALGTDSIASNWELDLWGEMRRIRSQFPDIDAAVILSMATEAGAHAFGVDHDYGTISKGKSSAFLHVLSEEFKNCNTESDLLNMLVSNGRPEQIEWIHQACEISSSN